MVENKGNAYEAKITSPYSDFRPHLFCLRDGRLITKFPDCGRGNRPPGIRDRCRHRIPLGPSYAGLTSHMGLRP